jgi:hypothetical protein
MSHAIIRTFIHLASAEEARAELLAAGIAADDVAIDMRIDETGPVQGNFAIGDDPDATGSDAYEHTFAPTGQDAVRDCQLTVQAATPALAQRAAAILDRLGAHDPDPAHRGATLH